MGINAAPVSLTQETLLSVSLCPPGPQALLLVIQLGEPFTGQFRKEVEGYFRLFNEHVWSHTLVLFTFGDWLGDTSIEQFIESEGEDLSWLVSKCGNRYHVLDNKNRTDKTQVSELLEKIEEIVAENRGLYFEMDRERLKETLEMRGKEEEKVKERLMKVEKQRKHLQSLKRELFNNAREIYLCNIIICQCNR